VSTGLVVLAGVVLSGALIGCSSPATTEPWEVGGTPSNDGGTTPTGDGAMGNPGSGGQTDAGGGGASQDSSGPGMGTPEAGAVGQDSSAPAEAGVDAGPVTSDDGFGAARTICINHINALRATDTAVALKPLTLVNTDTTDTCVDTQATNDESKMSAHYSFINNDPSCTWGNASGWAQDECLGGGAAGIESCLDAMWAEQTQPNCAGCIGCTAFGGACPNCDYSGTMGGECGHYVNMSAPYFTQVACGFGGTPTGSSAWAVQDFQ
jgi:hypothetical protein